MPENKSFKKGKKRPKDFCRLCGVESQLCESHIVPEFMYKQMYDDKHRIYKYSEHGFEGVHQKGLKEYLLCEACERRLAHWERYVKHCFYAKKGQGDIYCERTEDGQIWRNIDYKKFKLFQMSLLWRMSVSRSKEFEDVDLGPREETLREMILNDEPGEHHDFPCIMIFLKLRGEIFDFIGAPWAIRFFGQRGYFLPAASVAWIFLPTANAVNHPKVDLSLQEDGSLLMTIMDAEQIGLLRHQMLRIGRAYQRHQNQKKQKNEIA